MLRALLLLLLPPSLLALLGASRACDLRPPFSLSRTGIVCRITKPATLVLNQETTKVIQKAFQRAEYPDIKGEKTMLFLGKVEYGLYNIQISNLTIASSEVELNEDKSMSITIQHVSVTFQGTLKYGYTGAWLLKVSHAIDFEIESSIDLQINTRLTCNHGKVWADTSDCYLTFHKLLLHLHGDKQPGWIKQLFTDFISFTLKLVLKAQVCKEINTLSNIMAEFVQDTAADFLRNGDIGVDISLTQAPDITTGYIESHHRGLLIYKNHSGPTWDSTFSPGLIPDSRMLYFWFSDQVLNALALAAFLDQRLVLTLAGKEFEAVMLNSRGLEEHQDTLREILQGSSYSDAQVEIKSVAAPEITCQPEGTVVKSSVAVVVRVSLQDPTEAFYFEEDVTTTIQASYEHKKLILHLSDSQIHLKTFRSASKLSASDESIQDFLKVITAMVGAPMVISRIEPALTELMDSKGLNLFEIINPEILTKEGYLLLQMDFGFPQHLLVDFLKTIM
ncbi:cholesteryl ester transfer protein [Tachyglossus aculeatus]|uniref:cholesteryl ester transfer protein n=1 Tax=Tachyglossus aculeatus TaxID=9261 RepID=UPI0018F595E1|nr:cholesteryl ester transfer protein [Tachyglossus aculeatus]